jgi:hypothetical protein
MCLARYHDELYLADSIVHVSPTDGKAYADEEAAGLMLGLDSLALFACAGSRS